MSKNSSKGKDAVRGNEETSKDLVSMEEAMESAKELIKYRTPNQGTKERRGICISSSKNDSESSKKKDGEKNGSSMVSKIATVAAGAAVAVALVGGLIILLSGSGSHPETDPDPEPEKKRRTMKAPGQGYRIYRDDFEENPKEKFKSWREEKKMKKLNGMK